MRNRFSLLLLLLVGAVLVFGHPEAQQPQSAISTQIPQKKRTIVDFEADLMKPIKVGDSTALNLVGNVAFFHNGAIITCDSAIRYNDKFMECYGNVIINKETTYVYGDRADYNGITNIANVYSSLIKLVDEDVTMYCYNLNFNTLTNIGSFSGGATISQKDNLMESMDGYYNANTRVVVFDRDVQMANESYKIVTDSMTYNMDTEVTNFYTKAYIWNDKNQFLSSKHGIYYRSEDIYVFEKSSYVLTDKQEMWADSITYKSRQQESLLRRDIQIYDREQSSYLFGDYGQYWGESSRAFMTDNPSIVSIEVKEQSSDTLYMRADSLFIFTVKAGESFPKDTAKLLNMDSTQLNKEATEVVGDSLDSLNRATLQLADSIATKAKQDSLQADSLKKIAVKPVTKKELRAAEKAKRREAKRLERELKRRPPVVVDELPKQMRPLASFRLDSLNKAVKIDTMVMDSLKKSKLLSKDSLTTAKKDSLERIVRGYSNVKIFRKDFQSVGDSVVGFSVDSTLHMYGNPALWSDKSQVTSDVMKIFTRNEKLDRATFDGSPMMVEFVKDSLYNQVAGKYMEAFFRDNSIFKLEVDGNAQTYYYLQESDSVKVDIIGFLAADCAKIRFEFADGQAEKIIYIGDPVYTIYPMDKIPDTQTQFLKGFKWRGDERPKSKTEVFNRTMRPSVRKEMEALAKPKFPITQQIRKYKENLIKQNVWMDRDDKIQI